MKIKYLSNIFDMTVAFISAMAVLPIAFGTIFGYTYVTMFFAKEGFYLPWYIDQIFVLSTIAMFCLLVFFFVSIGQSVGDEIKRYTKENILLTKEGK